MSTASDSQSIRPLLIQATRAQWHFVAHSLAISWIFWWKKCPWNSPANLCTIYAANKQNIRSIAILCIKRCQCNYNVDHIWLTRNQFVRYNAHENANHSVAIANHSDAFDAMQSHTRMAAFGCVLIAYFAFIPCNSIDAHSWAYHNVVETTQVEYH